MKCAKVNLNFKTSKGNSIKRFKTSNILILILKVDLNGKLSIPSTPLEQVPTNVRSSKRLWGSFNAL